MTLRVSLEIAKSVGICDEVMPSIIKYYTDNNLESATLDEMIAHWKAIGRRDWALWLYSKRRLFEKLTGQKSSPEEVAAYEADEAYLRAIEVVSYQVNGVFYDTRAEAEEARRVELAKLKPQLEPCVTCNLEVISEAGDTTWQVIDLDDFIPPSDAQYRIQVFSPADGRYDVCASLEEALIKREENMGRMADYQYTTTAIFEIKKHPDFLHEPESIGV